MKCLLIIKITIKSRGEKNIFELRIFKFKPQIQHKNNSRGKQNI